MGIKPNLIFCRKLRSKFSRTVNRNVSRSMWTDPNSNEADSKVQNYKLRDNSIISA